MQVCQKWNLEAVHVVRNVQTFYFYVLDIYPAFTTTQEKNIVIALATW